MKSLGLPSQVGAETGCVPMRKSGSASTIRASRLYRDLHLDHRDAMYRALTFIARHGGPAPSADAKDALAAHRKRARNWLLAQRDRDKLLAAYEEFLKVWNPVFADLGALAESGGAERLPACNTS